MAAAFLLVDSLLNSCGQQPRSQGRILCFCQENLDPCSQRLMSTRRTCSAGDADSPEKACRNGMMCSRSTPGRCALATVERHSRAAVAVWKTPQICHPYYFPSPCTCCIRSGITQKKRVCFLSRRLDRNISRLTRSTQQLCDVMQMVQEWHICLQPESRIILTQNANIPWFLAYSGCGIALTEQSC